MTRVVSNRRPQYVHHTLKDNKGQMSIKQFRLKPETGYFWTFENAPREIQDLVMSFPGTPEMVTVVPMSLRFTCVPAGALEVYSLTDAIICFE